MRRLRLHQESHFVNRIGWLRAVVLGANDGIISTASLIIGVDRALARQVAEQLTANDALTAHACDELGISEITAARPVQATLPAVATFSAGAAMPLAMVLVSPASALVPIVSAASLGLLALLGAIGAKAGGSSILRATARVTFWGALAMVLIAGIGKLFGAVV
jgi:VIT1/CCC1 family predicted Fe2+/Mn2+ transporter